MNMNKNISNHLPQIAIIGLGSIAQKAYLPILTKELNWNLAGAYTPNSSKRKDICKSYRMKELFDIKEVMACADNVFVHSSTDSHFEVISNLLKNGKNVYVDKPLAATVSEAETLVELSEKYHKKLMVGFNRRFSPLYNKIKNISGNVSSIALEKHRFHGLGSYSYEFTLYDDYLHLIDTARWLGGELVLLHNKVDITAENQLLYAHHLFQGNNGSILTTSMHRNAGVNLEKIYILSEGQSYTVTNMNQLEISQDDHTIIQSAPSWETVLKQRGFEDCIHHFIDCIIHNKEPLINGKEALLSQKLVEKIINHE